MQQVPNIVRQRLQATAKADVHPDADLLAGFTEKSLTQRERTRVLEHLSQCGDCRDVALLASVQPDSASAAARAARSTVFRWPVLRWGTVAACVVIVSAAVVLRYERSARTPTTATTKPTQSSPVPTEKVAADRASQSTESSGKTADASRAVKQPARSATATGRLIANSKSESQAAGSLAIHGQSVPTGYGQAIRADLGGTVLDLSGAAVANAEVTAINVRTVQVTPGSTNATGQYRFEDLPIGNYRITVKASGFRTTTELAELTLNKPSAVNVILAPGDATETVEVEAAASAVNTEVAELTPERAKDAMGTPLKSKAASSSTMAAGANDYSLSARARSPAVLQKAVTLTPRWTLSPDGVLERSLDAGGTWETISVPATSALRALAAMGHDIWVGGAAGALYHSSDIGQHWVQITPTVDGKALTADVIGVTFTDATHGKLTTANDETWTTSDAGQSWQKK
jgi:hypothetical protein